MVERYRIDIQKQDNPQWTVGPDLEYENILNQQNWTVAENYTEGLPFTVGAGQMIAGFDKGVLGMKQGQTKIVKIPAVEAYGARDKANLIPFPKASFS